MRTLIVGGGEIGSSLWRVLTDYYDTDILDIDPNKSDWSPDGVYEIMHICFPYSDKFIEYVKEYKAKHNPKYVVIHSTVPVGTSRELNAVHSPVKGIHPHLEESLITFTKFLGGEYASEVADYFRRAGMKVYLFDKQETTEYMKIMSTTFYGMMIEFHKQVKNDCNDLDIPFEAFTLWNMDYNSGYEKLGYPEYKKPLLAPIMKVQGGHCTLPNSYLLENDFTKLLRERNNG